MASKSEEIVAVVVRLCKPSKAIEAKLLAEVKAILKPAGAGVGRAPLFEDEDMITYVQQAIEAGHVTNMKIAGFVAKYDTAENDDQFKRNNQIGAFVDRWLREAAKANEHDSRYPLIERVEGKWRWIEAPEAAKSGPAVKKTTATGSAGKTGTR